MGQTQHMDIGQSMEKAKWCKRNKLNYYFNNVNRVEEMKKIVEIYYQSVILSRKLHMYIEFSWSKDKRFWKP